MDNLVFYSEESSFNLTINGQTIPFRYYPSREGIWSEMKEEDFDIVLLNNPFLHKETDYFEIWFDNSDERGGFLLPITILESEDVDDNYLLSYMFISYQILLRRITEIPSSELISDIYSDAFVLVIHKKTKHDFCLDDYVFSLAKYGFYEYKGKLKVNYPRLFCIEGHPKKIPLKKVNVDNLSNSYVKDLFYNRLCYTGDFITRFVLVYQIVELYISEIHHKLLEDRINKYNAGNLTRNDFGEELKEISRESFQIRELVKDYIEEKVCNEYKQETLSLFNDVEYKVKNESLDFLLYALRNQVFHNYGIFDGHEDALTQVLFRFERVIIMLLSKRPIKYKSADVRTIQHVFDS